MTRQIGACLFLLLSIAQAAVATTPVSFIGASRSLRAQASVLRAAHASLNLQRYAEVRIRLVNSVGGVPDHAIVYLLAKKYHHFDIASIDLDKNQNALETHTNYQLQAQDLPPVEKAQCPDKSIEFIAFAPNEDQFEQDITNDVAKAAIAQGLKTVHLVKDQATRQNYLNYMSCPNLKGNFYDGDANPTEFITADGVITADDINTVLGGAFRFHVTNIWLACQAFNDPILSAVISGAQAQKYAAGINNLEIGPSDQAAACAMKAAFKGQPLTASFQSCYEKYDVPSDHWGFDGKGSNYFAK
jgi:hypothetical protein